MSSKKAKRRRRILKYIGGGALAVGAVAAVVLTGGAAAGPIVGAGSAAAKGQLAPKPPAEPSFLDGLTSTVGDITQLAGAGQKLAAAVTGNRPQPADVGDEGGGALVGRGPGIYRIPLVGPLLKAIFSGA